MEALFDRTGQVHAWLHAEEYIVDRQGRPAAFVVKDNVYDWRGQHIGWWVDGHMRDHRGAVVVFKRDATT